MLKIVMRASNPAVFFLLYAKYDSHRPSLFKASFFLSYGGTSSTHTPSWCASSTENPLESMDKPRFITVSSIGYTPARLDG